MRKICQKLILVVEESEARIKAEKKTQKTAKVSSSEMLSTAIWEA